MGRAAGCDGRSSAQGWTDTNRNDASSVRCTPRPRSSGPSIHTMATAMAGRPDRPRSDEPTGARPTYPWGSRSPPRGTPCLQRSASSTVEPARASSPRLEPRLPSVPSRSSTSAASSTRPSRSGTARRDAGGETVRWALMYPDAYEVGLPNQGVQILYEVLNERDWIVAERTYSVWPDMEQVMREGDEQGPIPQFTVDGHRPVRDFDVFGLSFSTELGYTNMLNALDLAGIPLHAVDRGEERPDRARRRPRGVQPRAGRRLPRRRRARRRRGGRARDLRGRARVEGRGPPRAAATSCCAASRSPATSTCPKFYDVAYAADGSIEAVVPEPARHPVPGPQAHADGPRRVALPGQAAGAAGRDRARAVLGRDLPRLHPRLPLLPGRHDHPPGPRALDRDHRRDGRERHPQVRLRGGRPALALQRRPHRDRRGRQGPRRPLRGLQRLALAAQHPRRRLQHHAGQRVLPQRPALGPDLRPRGRLGADAQGDQQDGHRGGPDPHGRRGVLPRLAAGEALLHVRPADRDRRGRPRRSPTSPRR